MKHILVFLFMLLGVPSAGAAGSSAALPLFNEANNLYAAGRYAEAASAYEDIAAKYPQTAELYYNLGNAYYKTGRYGKAVASFARASRIKPRDPDIRYNLDFTGAIANEPPEPFPDALLTSVLNTVSLNELTAVCSILFITLIFGVLFYMMTGVRALALANITAAAALILASVFLAAKAQREVFTREAVVISAPVDVRNGPGTENSVGFTLPEGRKVAILGENGGWSAIGLNSEGLKGWIETKYLEII